MGVEARCFLSRIGGGGKGLEVRQLLGAGRGWWVEPGAYHAGVEVVGRRGGGVGSVRTEATTHRPYGIALTLTLNLTPTL